MYTLDQPTANSTKSIDVNLSQSDKNRFVGNKIKVFFSVHFASSFLSLIKRRIQKVFKSLMTRMNNSAISF